MTVAYVLTGGIDIMSPLMFTRPEQPLPLLLTERDHAIVRSIAEHQFLDTQMVQALMPGSKQKLNRRLQALYENEYLERPKGQAVLKLAYGQRHFVYTLGPKGIDLLVQTQGLKGEALKQLRDRVRKWRERSNGKLAHDLEVSRFRVCLALALQSFPPLAAQPITPPAERVNIMGESLYIYPDWSFALTDTSEQTERTLYLEVDRGTMSPERFKLKLLAYRALYKALRKKTKHDPAFQVLTVTPNPKRRETLLAGAAELFPDSRMFLFATFTDYTLERALPLLGDPIWHFPAKGSPKALLDFE